MRRALSDANIDHCMLPDIVEVTDPQWQGAVEGVLRGYTSVILLDKASDAAAAYRIGENKSTATSSSPIVSAPPWSKIAA